MQLRRTFPIALTMTLLLVACQPAPAATPESPQLPSPTTAPAEPTATTEVDPTVEIVPTVDTFDASTGDGARSAEITEKEGNVNWRLALDTEWQLANVGQGLVEGNQVQTHTDGRATITFTEGTLVRLGPDTTFTMRVLAGSEKNPETLLELLKGQLFIIVKGLMGEGYFEVETDAGLAAVRGSYMSVELTPSGRVLVACLEGHCNLSNDLGSVDLLAGQASELLSTLEAPLPAGPMQDFQYNDWFENVPEAAQIALQEGIITQDILPIDCDLESGLGCVLELACDLTTGEGCLIPPECDLLTGEGCELPDGCNIATGEGCTLLADCDPATGEGCELLTGCNVITGAGCDLFADCDLTTGTGCTLPDGCNFITGEGCEDSILNGELFDLDELLPDGVLPESDGVLPDVDGILPDDGNDILDNLPDLSIDSGDDGGILDNLPNLPVGGGGDDGGILDNLPGGDGGGILGH